MAYKHELEHVFIAALRFLPSISLHRVNDVASGGGDELNLRVV